jgi:hypothetical protein
MRKHTGTVWLVAAVVLMIGRGLARAEQGGQSGSGVMLSPFVGGSVMSDSNVGNAPADEQSDTYLDGTLGVRGGYTGYALDVGGLGFLSRRSYNDFNDLNFTTFGDVLKVKNGTRDQFVIEVDQSFRRVEDVDHYGSEAAVGGISPDSALDASSLSKRDIHQAGVSAGRNLTDKTELDLGYRFDSLNYDDASFYDLISHYVQAETAYRMTDKTAGTLTLKYGLQKNDSLDQTADYSAARLGLKTRGTDKLTFKAGGGVQNFEYGQDNSKKTSFNFDGTALWAATEKVVFQAGGRNGMQLSSFYADNGSEFSILWGGIAWRMASSVTLSAAVSYREDDYLVPVQAGGVVVDRLDKGLGTRLRAEYHTPAEGMKLYAEVLQEKVDSNVSDYDKTRAGVGVVLAY